MPFYVMLKFMIPSPLSFFAVFSNNLKFFVVLSYVQDYDSKSFVVPCGV